LQMPCSENCDKFNKCVGLLGRIQHEFNLLIGGLRIMLEIKGDAYQKIVKQLLKFEEKFELVLKKVLERESGFSESCAENFERVSGASVGQEWLKKMKDVDLLDRLKKKFRTGIERLFEDCKQHNSEKEGVWETLEEMVKKLDGVDLENLEKLDLEELEKVVTELFEKWEELENLLDYH